MKNCCLTGGCRWMFRDMFKSWSGNIEYFHSSAAICGSGYPGPLEVFEYQFIHSGDHVSGGPGHIQPFLAAASNLCHTSGLTETRAGLTSTAWGGQQGFAEICSSWEEVSRIQDPTPHRDGTVSSCCCHLRHKAKQMLLFNSHGHQGCQDHKRQM